MRKEGFRQRLPQQSGRDAEGGFRQRAARQSRRDAEGGFRQGLDSPGYRVSRAESRSFSMSCFFI